MAEMTAQERAYLRELAKKQMEIAKSPQMDALRKEWYAHNDLQGGRPMVTFEMWTCGKELLPPPTCTSEDARKVEGQLISNITNFEKIKDDRVVPDAYTVGLPLTFIPFGIKVERVTKADSTGNLLGFHDEPVIVDLHEDMHKLGQTVFTIHEDVQKQHAALAQDVLGDIMPIKLSSGIPFASPSVLMLHMMGMENMMIAMMDYPDEFKQVMGRIADDCLSAMKELESKNLLVLNNGQNGVGQGTYGFTTRLPSAGYEQGHVRLKDYWGYLDSQETVGISPKDFEEFFFPTYQKLAKEYGRLNYGCCEAVHEIWDSCISKFTNLSKVSISPWCDVNFMGERLKGTDVVFHRKPSPTFVGVGVELDEEAFRAHVRETVLAARGCHLEFSFRDVYTLSGRNDKPSRAVAIVKEEIDAHWHA